MYGDVAYVRIPTFNNDLAESTLWKAKDSRALIVDLRGNLGGGFDVLERFAGYFHKDAAEIFEAVSRQKTEKVMAKPRTTIALLQNGNGTRHKLAQPVAALKRE